jgi:hypothetical protein
MNGIRHPIHFILRQLVWIRGQGVVSAHELRKLTHGILCAAESALNVWIFNIQIQSEGFHQELQHSRNFDISVI